MENLVVSIITVCYNSASTIEQTIQSVLQQSYKHIEYIIVDGDSNDGTVEIIKKYLPHVSKFISEPDKGIYDAMNKGIQNANGEIVGILNSDDLFFDKEIISKIVNAFVDNNTEVVYGNIVMSKHVNMSKPIRRWIAGKAKSFKWGWHPPHPGLFVRKSVYDKYGLYNIGYNVSADFDLMLRLFYVHKVTSYYLNEFIVNMRIGGESTGSLKNILQGNINIRKSFKNNNVGYIWFYPYIRIVKKILQFI